MNQSLKELKLMALNDTSNISDSLKMKAKSLGFLECVILPVDCLSEDNTRFRSWLKNDMQGEMNYMSRNIEKRLDPRLLFKNAKTIIIVIQNYFPKNNQGEKDIPKISRYAYGIDYHFVIKNKLKKLLHFINDNIADCNGRSFTDSAPVLERAWARRAGIGWIGKNSNLISVEHGSFFFIGELIIDIELPYDAPKMINDHCGNCTRCIDTCPTGAIVDNRIIDARKCISYQTIELKGELDKKLKGKFNNWIFGCDICQEVCPWNLKSTPHEETAFEPHPKLLNLTREQWYSMEKLLFNELFRNSAVKRTGYNGLKRNLKFIQVDKNKE